MSNNLVFEFNVNRETKSIHVRREFAAALEKVWNAWTDSKILDLWWAPKPFQTKTKSQDFSVGGSWFYAMEGPDNFAHYCRADYKSIEPLKSYSGLDAFCDADGNINEGFPRSLWNVTFTANGDSSTIVDIVTSYEKLEDLEKIIEMGFKEGFTMALGNLDELLVS
ncbi:MAG: SRPBCC domain-containing protein [Chitinophagales bacterium]